MTGRVSPDAPQKTGVRLILADPAVRVVILVVLVIMLGFGIVAPTLPLYARSFGVGYGAVGLLISSFAFTRLIFDLVTGPIIDRFGERRSAATGLLVVAVSSILTGLAPNFASAVFFRAAGGSGSAVLFAALYSYLIKVVPRDRMARTLSIFYGAFSVGLVAGGPLGGVIAHRFGLASPLFVYAGVLFLAGALYFRFVRDPDGDRPERGDGKGARSREPLPESVGSRFLMLLRDRAFLTVTFANFAYLWMIAAVLDTLVPLFARDALDMSTVGVGGVFAVALVGELAVLYHAGSLADRVGRKAVLIPSMAGLALVIVAAGWAPNVLVFVLMMAVLGVASGYAGVPPGAMLSDVSRGERTGTAVGMFRFAGDLGFTLGPFAAGVMAEAFGFEAAFALAAVPLFACVLLVLRILETLRRPAAPEAVGGAVTVVAADD